MLAAARIGPGQPFICLAPSKGIAAFRNLPDHEHTSALLNLINGVVSRWRLPVLVLPHVHDSRPRNDDRQLAAEIEESIAHPGVRAVPGPLTAGEYKAIAARSVLTIAERMHAAIGALSSGVPTVAVGYSQKFVGILSDTYGPGVPMDQVHLGVERFVNDDNSGARLIEGIDLLALQATLATRLPRITERARSNFARLAATIGTDA